MSPARLNSGSLRAQVLVLTREGLTRPAIAARIARSERLVCKMTSDLRKTGHLPDSPDLSPGSLRARCHEAVQAAGPAGLRLPRLAAELAVAPKSALAALRHLLAVGLVTREPDGLLLAFGVARAAEPTEGQRFAAMAPLARIEAYALTLARDGRGERAALFLRRAYDRVALGATDVPPAAVNLLVLADLIEAPEASGVAGLLRTYAGESRAAATLQDMEA